MALNNCITSVAQDLPDIDKQFLRDAVSNGATEGEAVDLLAQAIRQELQDIADRVESMGGTVSRETGPEFLAQTKDRGARHNMEIKRAERELAEKTRLSGAEKTAIKKAAAQAKADGIKGVTQASLETHVRSIKAQYPPEAGWAPMTLDSIDVTEKKGKPEIKAQFKPITYSFNKGDLDTMVNDLVSIVEGLRTRAAEGDENAKVILRQDRWYANMQTRLREEFGSLGDLFADLLGATSPKTPVATNWDFAVDALKNALAGEYDNIIDEVARWSAEVDLRNAALASYIRQMQAQGMTVTAIKKTPVYKKLNRKLPLGVAPLRSNGKRFGTNSTHVAKTLGDLWRMINVGGSPKARNFSGNLIGFTDEATIDVWAARLLQDLAGQKRVPPRAETAVDGKHLVGSTLEAPKVGGNFGFGQDVFRQAAERLDMKPSDLQAVVWFYQKEIWGRNSWTTVTGEGGSFEQQADNNPVDRFVGMLAMEQSEEFQGRDYVPSDKDMATEHDRLLNTMYGIEGVVAAKSTSTLGRYGSADERSFDLEMVANRGTDPGAIWSEIVRIGQENKQDAVGLSRVVQPDEQVDLTRHRPGMEVYFDRPTPLEALTPLLQQLDELGVQYFTFATDVRRTADVRAGGMGNVAGLRILYVPEFMGKPEGYEDMDDAALLSFMEQQRDDLMDIRDSVVDLDGVSYAEVLYYETRVAFSEEYGNADNARAGEAGPGSQDQTGWTGRTLREGFEASDRQPGTSAGDGTNDGTGDLPGVRPDYLTQSNTGSASRSGSVGARGLGPRGRSHQERGLPVRQDGTVPLTHWSTQEGLTALDPSFHGAGATGAERGRSGRADRTYYGAPGYNYLRDPGVASIARNPYFVAVDAERLYDYQLDPDGIHARLLEEAKARTQYGLPRVDPTDYENAVRDAGYLGYFVINPQFGPIIASFEALEVQPLQAGTKAPVWDETGAMEEPLRSTGDGPGERGRYYPSTRTIQLTKDSDLSSFLHEAAHFFLEMERMLAEEYGLDDEQAAILEWLGVDSWDDLDPRTERGKEAHERWAETFEAYLLEGKAPSLKLRKAFASFTRWLKQIYKALLGDGRLSRADLNPEIRGIFDRLLATEAEIEANAARPEYDQYFPTQPEGMSDADWADYQATADAVKTTAERTLDEKALEQYMKMRTKEWEEEREPMVEEEKVRLEQEPVYQIMVYLRENKIDRAAFKELLSDGKIPQHLQKMSEKGGLDPQLVAEQFGYDTAREMIRDLEQAQKLEVAATDAAQARMVEKYGDILNDGTLENEVREALVNDDQARLLLAEIKHLNRGNRVPGINREYLKAQAEKYVAGLTYKQIQPGKHLRTMARAAEEAGAAQDDATRLAAKIKQLANHYMYRESVRVKEQMEKHRRYVRRTQTAKIPTNEVEASYVQQAKMLANMYEMRKGPEQQVALQQIINFYLAQTRTQDGQPDDRVVLSLLDPNLIAALDHYERHNGDLTNYQLKGFEEMTAEEVHGVADMIRHLRYVGRREAEAVSDEAMVEVHALNDSVIKKGGKDHRGRRTGSPRNAEDWRRALGEFLHSLPSLGNLVRKLDGFEDGGAAFNAIYQRVTEAFARETALQRKFFEQFDAAIGDISQVRLKRTDGVAYTGLDGSYTIPADVLGSEQIFMAALYWGTESSREALIQGWRKQGWNVTEADILAIMSRLTPDQLQLVNKVWALNESMWPELREAAIAHDGFAPPKLPATPFTVNGVTMTGGHMQLYYDSQTNELKAENEEAQNFASVMPTKAGTLHARVGSGGNPVMLDINNIVRSMNDKIHFMAHHDLGRQLRRILNNKEFKAAVERKHGAAFYQVLIENVDAVTGARSHRESNRLLAKASRWMRSSATMMHLAFSVRNTVQQFGAMPIAMHEVGYGRWLNALSTFGAKRTETVEMVDEMSEFMRDRRTVINRDSREALAKAVATSKAGAAYQHTKSAAFYLQTKVDAAIAYPTWLAKFKHGMDTHGDKKRAITEADRAVGESVGSGADMHLGRIMQSNQSELVKTATVFGSWFNTYFQRIYKASKGGTSFANLDVAFDVLFLPAVVATLTQLLILDTPDDDEDEIDYAWKNYYKFMLATVPVVREFTSFSEGFAPVAPYNQFAASMWRIINELDSGLEGRQSPEKTAIDVGKAVATFANVPGSGQALRAADYAVSYAEGNEGDTFNPYQAMVEGPDRDK